MSEEQQIIRSMLMVWMDTDPAKVDVWSYEQKEWLADPFPLTQENAKTAVALHVDNGGIFIAHNQGLTALIDKLTASQHTFVGYPCSARVTENSSIVITGATAPSQGIEGAV